MNALFFAIFAALAGVALAAEKESLVIKPAAAAAGKGDDETTCKRAHNETDKLQKPLSGGYF